jgi:hypothetical protein
LEARSASCTAPHSQVVRARIVLLAAEGAQNVDIAKQVGVCVDVASRRRKRFCRDGLAGISIRFRANFAYVDGRYPDGTVIS